MKKEIVIIAVVMLFIICLNVFTSRNTNKVMSEIEADLGMVREGLIVNSDEQMKENIEKAKNLWKKEKDKLSVYIEHDELEKLEMYMTNINTDIETKEYNMALEALDTCTFIIEHIKDKYSLSIKNIF